MNNTKLVSVLMTFSTQEWSSFRKYLLMHTRKTSDNFYFFEFLNQRKKRLSTLSSAEEVRKEYFPKLTSKGFSNMMSRIHNWLEEWLAIDEFKQEIFREELMLIKSYNKRGLFKLANARAIKLEKTILAKKGLDVSYNKVLAELFHIQCYSENSIRYQDGILVFEKLVKHYLMFVQEYSSMYLPELINLERIQNYDFGDSIEQITQLIDLLPGTKLRIHFNQLIKIFKTKDPTLLEDLFEKVKAGVFSKDGFLHILLVYYLMSLSLSLRSKGLLVSIDMVAEIHDYAIGSGVLLTNKKIAPIRFHNIVSIIGALNSYDRAIEFVDKYYDLVDIPDLESSKKLAYAQVCLYHDRCDEIEKYISTMSFDNFDIKLRSYCLLAAGMYKDEELELDILLDKLNKYKRFLSRYKNRISKRYYESHFNFFDVVMQLSLKRFQDKKLDLSKYPNLIYRFWLKKELG